MEPWQIMEIKKSILGDMDADPPKPGLIHEALDEVKRIDVKKYRRVRIIFEYEFNERGEPSDSVEIRQRRPWK